MSAALCSGEMTSAGNRAKFVLNAVLKRRANKASAKSTLSIDWTIGRGPSERQADVNMPLHIGGGRGVDHQTDYLCWRARAVRCPQNRTWAEMK